MNENAERVLRALDAAERPDGRPLVAAIDGPSGSGKSTLAAAVRATAERRGMLAEIVHTDDLLDGWTGLESAVDALARQVLARLTERRPLGYRRYDWHQQHFSTPAVLSVCDLVVIEGVGAGASRLAPWVDVLAWIDAPADVRKQRALTRDGDDYAPWFDLWAAQEQAHHSREQTRHRADLTFET